MNPGLYRLHRVLLGLTVFAAISMLFLDLQLTNNPRAALYGGVFVALYIPMAVIHCFAAKGARDGQRYGIVLSRIVAAFWIIQFPIGTLLGAYVLWKGRSWQAAPSESTSTLQMGTA